MDIYTSQANGTLLPRSNTQTLARLRTSLKKELFVQALFDYNPDDDHGLPSRGLPLRFGDIIHVINASDNEWWQARYVITSLEPERQPAIGLVPSKLRVERRLKQKNKRVSFSLDDFVIGSYHHASGDALHKWASFNDNLHQQQQQNQTSSNLSLERKVDAGGFLKKLSSKLVKKGSYTLPGQSTNGVAIENTLGRGSSTRAINGSQRPMSYSLVEQVEMPFVKRPVVILGPTKEKLICTLLEDTEVFAACVSHTSRQPRPDEVNGRDFHFVPDVEQFKRQIDEGCFIEAGEFNNHVFATSAESVRRVLEQDRVCLLDVSEAAVPKLQEQGLFPFVVLLKPESMEDLKQLLRRYTQEQVQRAFEKCQSVFDTQWSMLSAIVPLRSNEQALQAVRQLVDMHCKSRVIWMPIDQASLPPMPKNNARSMSMPRRQQQQQPASPTIIYKQAQTGLPVH